MSRKSKKGFKKLENHELVSFQQGDSGSESELLDLSTEAEPTGRVRYYQTEAHYLCLCV